MYRHNAQARKDSSFMPFWECLLGSRTHSGPASLQVSNDKVKAQKKAAPAPPKPKKLETRCRWAWLHFANSDTRVKLEVS